MLCAPVKLFLVKKCLDSVEETENGLERGFVEHELNSILIIKEAHCFYRTFV